VVDITDPSSNEVPPTGMLEWAPRPDVLRDGVAAFRDRIGGLPLVLHSRHISPASPYLTDAATGGTPEWWVELTAHPADPAFFERWAADAAAWGATCIEQDWMVMSWFGARGLRAEPGRALAWQQGLDRAAAAHDLTLLWCMATPGDYLATVELERICAVRTCDDYRYADDPARLWRWYLTVNRLAEALHLPVSKDCFFTGTDPGTTGHDGDPHAEVEALLAGLSGGVVGIGDRLGCTDPSLITRLCRPDGVLVGPDTPLALTDRSLFDGADRSAVTWARATTTHGTGDQPATWTYLVALHTADTDQPLADTYPLEAPTLVYDWRQGTAEVVDAVSIDLAPRDWALFVCCPVLDGDHPDPSPVLIGDPTRLATMGRTRVVVPDDGTPHGLAGPDEAPVALRWWHPDRGVHDIPG
jgi:hypothetical protein